MKRIVIIGVILLLSVGALYSQQKENNRAEIVLAGGCFWGTEHFLKLIDGVVKTDVGMANASKGIKPAEVVKVEYNSQIVSLEKILDLYFMTIDPTSLNKQGEDVGVGYRTGIYYTDIKDLPVIENAISELSREHSLPIVIEVMPLNNYRSAEEKHQDYLVKNKDGYCRIGKELFDYVKQANQK